MSLILIFAIGFLLISQDVSFAQDYPHVQYGSLSRQYLDIYIAPATCPTPVYFDAHGNGGNTSMPISIVDSLKYHGISIVAWESLTTINNTSDILTGWADAELMFSWVKAHAATYNFDTTNFIIGGSSRGTILSWKYVQRPNPNNKGLYMYNALPSVWGDSLVWWPPNDVKVSAPPIFFVYLEAPGCSTLPTSDPNFNIHDPNNGYKIMAKYNSLGIGDRDTLIHSLYKTTNLDKYQFLLDFALKVIKPCWTTGINPILADTSSLKVFPNPISDYLTINANQEIGKIEIFSVLGLKVLETELKEKIDVRNLPEGIYFLIIKSGNFTETKKFVIIR